MDAGQDLPSVLSRLAVLEKQLNGVLENGIVAAERKTDSSTQKSTANISSMEQEQFDKESFAKGCSRRYKRDNKELE